jgi:2,3-bisphosphoglycerate-independent phosphoglycerate mutase
MTKILFILIDGLGDHSLPELQNKTPLEHAHTPNMDALAGDPRRNLEHFPKTH